MFTFFTGAGGGVRESLFSNLTSDDYLIANVPIKLCKTFICSVDFMIHVLVVFLFMLCNDFHPIDLFVVFVSCSASSITSFGCGSSRTVKKSFQSCVNQQMTMCYYRV